MTETNDDYLNDLSAGRGGEGALVVPEEGLVGVAEESVHVNLASARSNLALLGDGGQDLVQELAVRAISEENANDEQVLT